GSRWADRALPERMMPLAPKPRTRASARRNRPAGRGRRCSSKAFPAGRFLVGRHVAAGEDDALGAEIAHERVGYVVGVDLAVDLGFPDPPGDQLRVLRTEVEDQDFLVHYSAR